MSAQPLAAEAASLIEKKLNEIQFYFSDRINWIDRMSPY
jgi:hypothetical protein